jgi:hypothetical protein
MLLLTIGRGIGIMKVPRFHLPFPPLPVQAAVGWFFRAWCSHGSSMRNPRG